MHNILVGTDGSDGANRAIDIASELARTARGTLTIVAVGAPLLAKETEQELLEEELSEVKERARRTGLKPNSISTKLLWGDPTEALIEVIRREKADAIVVGRRDTVASRAFCSAASRKARQPRALCRGCCSVAFLLLQPAGL